MSGNVEQIIEAAEALIEAARPYVERAAPGEQLWNPDDYRNFDRLSTALAAAVAAVREAASPSPPEPQGDGSTSSPSGSPHGCDGASQSSPRPCRHDSKRRDGTLDAHCLLCGADGYWHDGHRHDEGHPSGKVLIRLGCPDARAGRDAPSPPEPAPDVDAIIERLRDGAAQHIGLPHKPPWVYLDDAVAAVREAAAPSPPDTDERVEQMARLIAGPVPCWCPDDWREPFDKAACPLHGGQEWPAGFHRERVRRFLAADAPSPSLHGTDEPDDPSPRELLLLAEEEQDWKLVRRVALKLDPPPSSLPEEGTSR